MLCYYTCFGAGRLPQSNSPTPSSTTLAATIRLRCHASTLPSSLPARYVQQEAQKFESILPRRCSWSAIANTNVLIDLCRSSAKDQKLILKGVLQSGFKYLRDMHRGLRSCPNLRLLHDTAPEQSRFVHKYLTNDLLSFAQQGLPIALTKRILKGTLRGLAALHDHKIFHTGKLRFHLQDDKGCLSPKSSSREFVVTSTTTSTMRF